MQPRGPGRTGPWGPCPHCPKITVCFFFQSPNHFFFVFLFSYKRGQIKGERPQEVHGPPSGSEAEAGGGKEPRAMAQTRLPVVTAHLGRPVIPSALWESSLPGEIRIL